MTFERDTLYLVAGIIGLAAAAVSAIGAPDVATFGAGAAALVDGRPIPKEAAARAVEALRNDKRNAVTKQDERAALERLIEEELLVQRGVELGLAETDLGARKAIVQSMLQLAISERAGETPSGTTLRAFHRENAGFFAPAARVQASLVFVRAAPDAATRVQKIKADLARGASASMLGDAQALALPATPLGPNELRTYLGAGLTASALRAKPGDIIEQDSAEGVRLLRVDGWYAAPAPPYEDVAEEVRAEWDRRADERAVRDYLDRLKRRARITRTP
ncbi:MAG: peptidylprolyl isomerase [Alphaproteobacteria bacterium]|nr:peptidylprolyl isomerase [Alphaproteobacteria bacterium]